MDDEFDYDYSFSASEDDDEEVRQEIELDDIRSDLRDNPLRAATRLQAMAEKLDSAQCVNAAFDLLKVKTNAQNFHTLMDAVAYAPADVDSFSRISHMESAWAMLDKEYSSFESDLQALIPIYQGAVNILKSSEQFRVYAKALLCMAHTYLKMNLLNEAKEVVKVDLHAVIESCSHDMIWVSEFTYQAKVLELEICVSSSPIDFQWLESCLSYVKTPPRGFSLPVEKSIVNEAEARLLIESNCLVDAKSLLEKATRGYEETISLHSSQLPLVRSVIFLVLISTILGEGNYDARLELPIVRSLENDVIISAVITISKSFIAGDLRFEPSIKALNALESNFATSGWKLATVTILQLLRKAFLQLQTGRALKLYNRITLESLISKVGIIPVSGPLITEPTKLTLQTLSSFILGKSFYQEFRINSVDGTIDEVNEEPDWRVDNKCLASSSSDSAQDIPFPNRYQEHEKQQARKDKESKILDRWKVPVPPKSIKNHNLKSSIDDESCKLLMRAIDEHRSAMAR